MAVVPPKAAQMAEGQAGPRCVRQQVKEKEVKQLEIFLLADLPYSPEQRLHFFRISFGLYLLK